MLTTYVNHVTDRVSLVYWHIIGTWIIIISLLVCTRATPASAKFVFTDFENHTGWSNNGFVVLLGLLQSQYSFTGYDSAAHMVSPSVLSRWCDPSPYPRQILTFWVFKRPKRHRTLREEDQFQSWALYWLLPFSV
jgi:hypothetical protein